jgi:hypothetical protein
VPQQTAAVLLTEQQFTVICSTFLSAKQLGYHVVAAERTSILSTSISPIGLQQDQRWSIPMQQPDLEHAPPRKLNARAGRSSYAGDDQHAALRPYRVGVCAWY